MTTPRLIAVSVLLLGGCAIPKAPRLTVYPPPMLPIVPARETIVPTSQFMKLAVLNVIDQTGKAGTAVEPLADELTTELHKTARFEVYDRGQTRNYDFAQVIDRCQKESGGCKGEEKDSDRSIRTAHHLKEYKTILADADAVVVTAITAIQPAKIEIDWRLVNAHSFTVMVAGTAVIPLDTTAGALRFDRLALERVAIDLRGGLPKPTGKHGKVLVQDGAVLTLSLGRKDGVIPGLSIFVIAPVAGDNALVVDESYLAQAYVVSVYDNTSQVVVFKGNDYRVGDDVRFK